MYNSIFRSYRDNDPFDEINNAIRFNDGEGSLWLNEMPEYDVDLIISEFGVDKDELTEEEYEELIETAQTAECEAYEDKLDALKNEGYKVKYKWVATSLQFTLTEES